MHVFYLDVVPFELTYDQFLVDTSTETFLDFTKTHGDVGKLFDVSFGIFGAVKKSLRFFFQHINLVIKYSNLILEITFIELINIDNIMISMFADSAPKTDARTAILAKTFDILRAVIVASENVRGRRLFCCGGIGVGDASAWYTS